MKSISLLILCLMINACASSNTHNYQSDISELSLKELYTDSFLIGAAINKNQIFEEDMQSAAIVTSQFNSLTAENEMKWESIHPLENKFNFVASDKLVELGKKNQHFLVGHTLVWHSQTPDWVFEDQNGDPATRELLLQRLEKHITTIVSRYRGKVQAWDVVNEAFNDDGTLRQSKWLTIIGPDYLEKAFSIAHAADPEAELYYNDYNLFDPRKRAGLVKLLQDFKSKNIHIDGVGIQGHYSFDYPDLSELEKSIQAFIAEDMSVMFTELDVSVLKFPEMEQQGADISIDVALQDELNPYADGLPLDIAKQQANYYKTLFSLFLKYKKDISRVTFWGLNDGHSWRNDWPMKGRTDYPLLFDRNNQTKLAYEAIVKLKQEYDRLSK